MSAFDGLATDDLRDGALMRLRRLVELESPSGDEVRLRSVAGFLSASLAELHADVETVDVPGVGEHVVARIPGADPALAPLVVLGHIDTVHPVGSFTPTFRLEDGRAHGPGVFDMKGGWACCLEALARLDSLGRASPRPVTLLATCDEETGSETSRGLIEETATGARAVLVLEPSLPGGAVKTRRKGVGWYRIEAHGRAAHAGVDPGAGVNAIVELAHQIVRLQDLPRGSDETTLSVGETGGGTTSNVVPARAWAIVDVRCPTMEECEAIDRRLRALEPVLAGARVEVSGSLNRPPLERTPEVADLFEAARSLAAEAGWELGEGATGGGSDGSFTAALGVPTLDGLGPEGAGAHADHEHVVVEDLGRRVRLYGRLFETL